MPRLFVCGARRGLCGALVGAQPFDRKEVANAAIAEPESCPEDDADDDGNEGSGERFAGAEVDAGRSAEVAGEQDGAEESGARDEVEDRQENLKIGEMGYVV